MVSDIPWKHAEPVAKRRKREPHQYSNGFHEQPPVPPGVPKPQPRPKTSCVMLPEQEKSDTSCAYPWETNDAGEKVKVHMQPRWRVSDASELSPIIAPPEQLDQVHLKTNDRT